MFLTAHIAVLVLALAAAAVLAGLLPLRKNILFYFLLAQVIVYCFAAPTYVVFADQLAGTELGNWYLYTQILCLTVFVPVMTITYLSTRQQTGTRVHPTTLTVESKRLSPFMLLSCGGTVLYIALLAFYGLLFRRIGHNALAAAYLNLPTLAFAYIRIFDRLLLALVLVNYLAYRYSPGGSQKYLCRISFATTMFAQLAVAGINSRFELINTFSLLAIVHLLNGGSDSRRKTLRLPLGAVIAGGLLVAGLFFTMKFREHWQGTVAGTLHSAMTSASESSEEIKDGLFRVASRLDGIDLVARMGPTLQTQGLSWGRSWYPSFLATFGFLWDAEGARDVKADLATTPKYYLMYEYAGITSPDYQSCVLTDAYGNFGVAGILLAAIVIGAIAGTASRYMVAPPSRLFLLLSIAGLQVVSQFEASLLTLLAFAWARQLPSLFVLLLSCPLRPRSLGAGRIAGTGYARRPNHHFPNRQRLHPGL